MKQRPSDPCSICNELLKKQSDKLYLAIRHQLYKHFGIKDRILYEDEMFVVIPSLGPITECHLLLVPKVHVSAFALLDKEYLNKAERLIHGICSIIEHRYGKSIVFEHGTLNNELSGSASCDHAHMHILACRQSIYLMLLKDGLQLRNIKNLEQLNDQKMRGMPYFYYSEKEIGAYIMDDVIQKSQYIRMLVAEAIHAPEKWDWKADWRISDIAEMIYEIQNDLGNLRKV